MWPKHWTQCIKRLKGGNERVIGIQVKGSPESVYIINQLSDKFYQTFGHPT